MTEKQPVSKKIKYGHLYEKIERSKAANTTPSFTPRKFLSNPHQVDVIGVTFSGGQPKEGVESGPNLLIKAGILDQLERLGWKVNCPDSLPIYEDLQPLEEDKSHPILKNVQYVSKVAAKVQKLIKKTLNAKNFVLTLGGDHSIGMATVSATLSEYPELGVIWVDAHAVIYNNKDINTAETTESGNLHGCPISFLMGIGSKVEAFKWLKPCLRKEKLVYIGLRDVDAGEKKILKEHNIKSFSMHEVDKYGIGRVMEMALEYLGDIPLHLSFDVDAMDPVVAPATGTPVRGGLTFREGHYICEEVFNTGRLVAMDMVEVNPDLGKDEIENMATVAVTSID